MAATNQALLDAMNEDWFGMPTQRKEKKSIPVDEAKDAKDVKASKADPVVQKLEIAEKKNEEDGFKGIPAGGVASGDEDEVIESSESFEQPVVIPENDVVMDVVDHEQVKQQEEKAVEQDEEVDVEEEEEEEEEEEDCVVEEERAGPKAEGRLRKILRIAAIPAAAVVAWTLLIRGEIKK